jgi:hypothetical protein
VFLEAVNDTFIHELVGILGVHEIDVVEFWKRYSDQMHFLQLAG